MGNDATKTETAPSQSKLSEGLSDAASYRIIDAAFETADIVKCYQCEYNFSDGHWCRVVDEKLNPNLCPLTQGT